MRLSNSMKFTVFTTILGLIFSFGDMTWQEKNSAWAERIAFVSSNKGSGKVIQEIWTIQSDGTDRRMLTNSPDLLKGWPTWSPDGAEIVFATHEGIGTLHLMDAAGGHLKLITEGFYPSWQPSGLVAVNLVERFVSTWGWVKVGGSRR